MAVPVIARTRHRHLDVGGVRVFYRESVPVDAALDDAPVMLLLHGFPSGSHQFRRLIDTLGSHYRLIAPDYPGFGHSDAPGSATVGGTFTYTFDHLADVMEGFVEQLGLARFVMYMVDFGGPGGCGWLSGIRSGSPASSSRTRTPTTRACPMAPATSSACALVARAPSRPCATCSRCRRPAASTRTAPATRSWSPPTGGRSTSTSSTSRTASNRRSTWPSITAATSRDTPSGRPGCAGTTRRRSSSGAATTRSSPRRARGAYLRDVPDAELHLFDTGHFALEENLPEIAPLIADFLDRTWPHPAQH